MKRRRKDLDEIFNRDLPSASNEEMEVDAARVLDRLRASGDHRAVFQMGAQHVNSRRALRTTAAWLVGAAAVTVLAVVIGMWTRHPALATAESADGELYRVM